jgi:hypothetical protein
MRCSILLVVLFAIVGICTGVARADYTVTWCHGGSHAPPFVNGGSKYYEIEDRCENNPPVVNLDGYPYEGLSGYEGMLRVGWYKVTVTAPAGVTISSIHATLVSEALQSGSPVYVEVGDDGGSIYSQDISRAGPTTSKIDQTLPGGNKTVWFGEFCSPYQNVNCFFASPWGLLAVEGFSLTLHDDERPSLSFTGGRLLLPGAQAGTEDVTFSASAQESGIAEVDAYLGSTLVGSDAYQSTQCSYTQFYPCPKSVGDDLKIDTAKVPDGTYPLILEASDASGNTVSVASSVPITVANHASPAGGPQGASAQASSTGPGAPNGHSATTKAQISYLSGQQGKIRAREGQSVTVGGRLTNQTGTPIPAATLEVLSQTVGSNASFAVIGHASTDASGVFTFRVPAGPSRVIRTGYRAFTNDSGYDATADLAENVTATTSLGVTPKRLRGRTFTFYGQVHAGSFPPRQQVDIKALIGSSWTHVTFAAVASNGRFKVRYRLKHYYSHVTFIFRATPVASPIWPYEPQQSNPAQLYLL